MERVSVELELGRLDKNQRKLGVLYEEIDTKFRLLMEGFGALHKKFDNVEVSMNKKFEEIDYKFDYLIERFDKMDARLDVIAIKLGRQDRG